MKKILSSVLALVLVSSLSAQISMDDFIKKQQNAFNSFVSDKQAEFDAFRQQQNDRYAEFMKNNWERYDAMPIAIPEDDEFNIPPVVYVPPVVEPEEDSKPIVIDEDVIEVPVPSPQPEPIAPVVPHEEIRTIPFAFTFFGTKISVDFPIDATLKLNGVSENELSNAWKLLSSKYFDATVSGVLNLRRSLSLCDWGYLMLIKTLAESKYNPNEAIFIQAFLLTQSGYKVRLASDDDGILYLLIATEHDMYYQQYFNVDGDKFYALNSQGKTLSICKAFYEKEQSFSLLLSKEQLLAIALGEPRKLTSQFGVSVTITTNKNTIDFLNTYPKAYFNEDFTTKWALNANTPLDQVTKDALYPAIRESIAGLTERDAVNKILNFMQTAFVYEYDSIVWGYDRAFFPVETLYYPYADCEDRAILFSRIIRDVMGLRVVLLYYPGHLATAVEFTNEVSGDYLIYQGRRYVVCDPTYIYASLGRTMPGMNNSTAKVIVLE